jgi:hypothetical protein
MKITLMVVLILTIAGISHLALMQKPRHRGATEQLPRGVRRALLHFVTSSQNMWISIIAVVIIAAICLGITVIVMQPAERV